MAYDLVKHQERAGHAPTSPTEARDNAYGGFSLRGLDAATDGRKGMNQMLKKKEPNLFKGGLGWITVFLSSRLPCSLPVSAPDSALQ
jgi:hypothetical protein